MSSLFYRVLKQARRTFDRKNVDNFKNEFTILKQLLDQLTLNDIKINPELITKNAFRLPNKAPCTYIHIMENEEISMSVFILNANYTMPLHDHPMMHGLLRVISGKLEIKSFTDTSEKLPINFDIKRKIRVRPEPVKNLTTSVESAVLTPRIGNYHEITAVDEPAAFFDVLGPPYDAVIPKYGQRKCSFYSKHEVENSILLKRIPIPNSYYCDNEPYSLRKNIDDLFQENF